MGDESTYPIKLEAWRTSDDQLHDSEWSADLHESHLRKCQLSSKLLDEGRSLAEVFEATGEMQYWEMHRGVLSLITKDSGLVISHWQCADNPGYRVGSRKDSGRWWVWGDSGSWSGYYGNEMNTTELIHHAVDTMNRHGGVLPPIWIRPNKESSP